MALGRKVIAPLLIIFMIMLSSAFLMTFLSLRLADEGFSDLAVGVVQAAFYAGVLAGSLLAQHLIRRFGHLRSDAMATSVMAMAILLMVFWVHPLHWGVLRALQGISMGILFVVIESWLLANVSNEQCGRVLGWYSLALYGGQTLSQPILSILNWHTAQPMIVSALLCSAALLPVALVRRTAAKIEITVHHPLKFLRAAPMGATAGLVSGIILAAFYAFGPIYAEDSKLSAPYIMGLLIAGGVAVQWPFGWLADRVNRHRLLLALAALSVALCLILWLAPVNLWLQLLLIFLIGSVTFTLYPIGLVHLADHVAAYHLVGATVLLNLLYGIGSVLGPILAPTAMAPLGSPGLFAFVAFWCFLLLIVGLIPFKLPPVIHHEAPDLAGVHPVTPGLSNPGSTERDP